MSRLSSEDDDDDEQAGSEHASSEGSSLIVSFLRNQDNDDISCCTPEIAQAVADIRLSSGSDFAVQESVRRQHGTTQRFRQLVAGCATDATHGARAMAQLLPLLGPLMCPEYACFGVALQQQQQQQQQEEDNEDDLLEGGKRILLELLGTTDGEGLASRRNPATGVVLLPGYQILVAPLSGENDGRASRSLCFYLPVTDPIGLTQALVLRPDVARRIGQAIVRIMADATTAQRVTEEPLLAQLYEAIMAGYHQSGNRDEQRTDLHEMAFSVETGLSRIKNQLLSSIQETDSDAIAAFADVTLHLECIDKLVGSVYALARCSICNVRHRVDTNDAWVDLTDCCSQALCVKCFDRCTRLDKLPLRLFPKCPFCACSLNLHALDRYQETITTGETQGRGKLLAWMQAHVRLDDGDGSFCAPESVAALKKSHYFSPCKSCACTVAVRHQCVAGTTDLPDECCACTAARPLDTKMCPRCSAKIERIGSFNDVTCVCGQHICWVCGAAVKDRDPEHYVFGYYSRSCISVRSMRNISGTAKESEFKDQAAAGGVGAAHKVPKALPEFKDQVRNVPSALQVPRPPRDGRILTGGLSGEDLDQVAKDLVENPHKFKFLVGRIYGRMKNLSAFSGGVDSTFDAKVDEIKLKMDDCVLGFLDTMTDCSMKDQVTVRAIPSNASEEYKRMHSRLPTFKGQSGEVGQDRHLGAANESPQPLPTSKDQVRETVTPLRLPSNTNQLPRFKDQVQDVSPADQERRRVADSKEKADLSSDRSEGEHTTSNGCNEDQVQVVSTADQERQRVADSKEKSALSSGRNEGEHTTSNDCNEHASDR